MEDALAADTRGNRTTYVTCSRCSHQVQVLDRQFFDHGPIRCGACGAELPGTILGGSLPRMLEEVLEGSGG